MGQNIKGKTVELLGEFCFSGNTLTYFNDHTLFAMRERERERILYKHVPST